MTSAIAVQTFESTLSHHCEACAAEFTVDEIRGDIDRFRVRLTVHNTGERGRIALRFDTSHVFMMNAREAETWREQYPRIWVQDRAYELSNYVERLYFLHPVEDT